MLSTFGSLWGNYQSALPAGGEYTFVAFWVTKGNDELNETFKQQAQRMKSVGLSLSDGGLFPNFYPAMDSQTGIYATQYLCVGFYDEAANWYGFVILQVIWPGSGGYVIWAYDTVGADLSLLSGWTLCESTFFDSSHKAVTVYIHFAHDEDGNGHYIAGEVRTSPPDGEYTKKAISAERIHILQTGAPATTPDAIKD